MQQMTQQPIAALQVADLLASLAFYTKQLSFTLVAAYPEADRAEITHPGLTNGYVLLLAGPQGGDIIAYLSGPRLVLKPGEHIRVFPEDLAATHAHLDAHGLAAQSVETVWERSIQVQDPDGYSIHFIQLKQPSPQETLALYATCPDDLEAALAGLAAQDLELRRSPHEWTIRQIVHHIADGDDLWSMALKAALTKPGFHYSQHWYSTDNAIAGPLDYAGRAIEPALALFRAHRAHITQLMQHLPDAWERYILFSWQQSEEAEKVTAGTIIRAQTRHAEEHIEEIRAILRANRR